MSPNSIKAARAQLAARRARRTWESDFWDPSDFLDLPSDWLDTVPDTSIWFSETIARNITDVMTNPSRAESISETIKPFDRSLLKEGTSIISIMISGEMIDRGFLDLVFIKYSSALSNNKLLQLRDKNWKIYVWNRKNKSNGTIRLIEWEKWSDGKMHYNKEYNTNDDKIKLTFSHQK